MDRHVDDVEVESHPRSPQKRHSSHTVSIFRPCVAAAVEDVRVPVQPRRCQSPHTSVARVLRQHVHALHVQNTFHTLIYLFFVQLPPPKIARKLVHVVLGYLLCMCSSLMLVHWAMSQLPSPAALAADNTSPKMMTVWAIPRSFDELRMMQLTLQAYRADHFPQLILAFCVLYLFMQCFTIPGCFFLTVLLGSLLSHVPATIVATALITVGCLVNYQLSKYILTDLLLYAIPNQVLLFQQAVSDQGSQNLFNYMLFLRVVAILPSWMINLASPLANVPVGTFISSAVIGFQPQIFIMISGGRTISQIHSWKDVYNVQSICTVAVCGVLSVLPIMLRKWTAANPSPEALV